MAEAPPVLVARDGEVAVLSLNRPARRNAMTPEMDTLLREAIVASDRDPQVRAIVIRGEGGAFCAGVDLAAGPSTAGPAAWDVVPAAAERFRFHALMAARKPVIAAIDGPAIGVGLALALHCDIRIASARARLALNYARIGLVAEYGLAWLLPRLVGLGHATELLVSGRTMSGEEAARIGLVQMVAPDETHGEAVIAYAQDLARSCAPRAVAAIKAELAAVHGQDHLEAVRSSGRDLMAARSGADFAEGAAAFRERRPARFAPLDPLPADTRPE